MPWTAPWMYTQGYAAGMIILNLLTVVILFVVAARVGSRPGLTLPSRREYVVVVLTGKLFIFSCSLMSWAYLSAAGVVVGLFWGGILIGVACYMAYEGRKSAIDEDKSQKLFAGWDAPQPPPTSENQ